MAKRRRFVSQRLTHAVVVWRTATLRSDPTMWTLTPDYLASTKEELKGRRAAIQARIADELKAIDAELEEIEALERVAYAFAVKHLPELSAAEPAPVLPPELAEEQVAALQAEPAIA